MTKTTNKTLSYSNRMIRIALWYKQLLLKKIIIEDLEKIFIRNQT